MCKVINQVSDPAGVAAKGAIPLARWLAGISSKELELWRHGRRQARRRLGHPSRYLGVATTSAA